MLLLLFMKLSLVSARMLHAFHFQDESTPGDLRYLASLSNLTNLDIQGGDLPLTNLITPLLVTRVSGTPSNAAVRAFIVKTLESLDWHVTLDTFNASTPDGIVSFTNLIASRTPSAARKLILSAHYDSKLFPFPFIGATDSSAPCAILLGIAVSLNELLKSVDSRIGLYGDAYPGLELVFFDGEEAVKDWTDTDSLYGSRHLAHLWGDLMMTPAHASGYGMTGGAKSKLDTIDVLVLLDLLGMKGSTIPNSNLRTAWMWKRLVKIETDLFDLGLLAMKGLSDRMFVDVYTTSQVGDDHLPFMQKGVETVHVIPQPFPVVWHSIKDDASCLDQGVVDDLAKIFRVLVAEYCGLLHK